jgi:uncharacterized protein
MGQRAIWWFAVIAMLLCAWPALQLSRGYRAERQTLVPRHGPVEMPADVRALGFTLHRIQTRSGVIAGWFVPPKGGATIILCHGSSADRRSLLTEARALVAAGHGVWMFDWPGHGESVGRVDFGAGSRTALQAVVDTVASWPGVDAKRLGLYAFSMGGVVAVPVAAKEKRLRALVIVSSPVDLEQQMAFEYADVGRLRTVGAGLFWRIHGISLAEMNIQSAASLLGPRPVLVVAGDADLTVPPSDGVVLTKAIGPSASLWTIRGASHGGYAAADPAFPGRVADFFTQRLAPSP